MQELREVEITGIVITARYGTLSSGTILRCDAAYARHLVEDAGAARYVKTETAIPKTPATKPTARRKTA